MRLCDFVYICMCVCLIHAAYVHLVIVACVLIVITSTVVCLLIAFLICLPTKETHVYISLYSTCLYTCIPARAREQHTVVPLLKDPSHLQLQTTITLHRCTYHTYYKTSLGRLSLFRDQIMLDFKVVSQ